jgi:hypothetical protein
MNLTETMGAAHWAEVDLRPLRCLICGCKAEDVTMRVTRIEDGRWLAVCDDCCDFFGAVSAWRRAFQVYDAVAAGQGRGASDPQE